MKLENDHRYLVSIGTFRGEQAAIARRKASLDAGLRAEIIDTQDDTQANILAALLLIADKLDKLTKVYDVKPEPEKDEKKTSDFAQKVRNARKKRGLTQEELGILAGISSKSVSRVETGEETVTDEVKGAIMRVLKIKEDK